jgi:hypothetical protein
MLKVKGFSQDATYDQSGAVKRLCKQGPYYSLDLEAATDRFPVKLLTRLLTVMLGDQDKANDYIKILTGYPFFTVNGNINYAVGQPMGAYSS